MFGIDFNTLTVLVVHNVEDSVSNNDAVGSAKAALHPAGEIHLLFDENNRIVTGLLCRFHLFEHIGRIAGGTFFHFRVVPAQIFGRVSRFHAQRLPELVFAQRVSVGAFGGVVTALIVVALAESGGRRAVKPTVSAGCGENGVFTHFPSPPPL